VVKGCDLKALVGLVGESQLKRENLYIIGVPCIGVLASVVQPDMPLTAETSAAKCSECGDRIPVGADFVPAVELSPTACSGAAVCCRDRPAGGVEPGRALGLLAGAVQQVHQVLCLPPGLSVLFLRAVPV